MLGIKTISLLFIINALFSDTVLAQKKTRKGFLKDEQAFQETIKAWETANDIHLKKGEWKTAIDSIKLSNLPQELLSCKNLTFITLNERTIYQLLHQDSVFNLLSKSCSFKLEMNSEWQLEQFPSKYRAKVKEISMLNAGVPITTTLDSLFNLLASYPNLQDLSLLLSWQKADTIYANNLRELPKGLGGLTHLSDLHILGEKINTIPSCIEHLKKLKDLRICITEIRDLNIDFSHFKNLKQLVLRNNKLNNISASVWLLPQLEGLSIRGNQFSHLSDSIRYLRNLKILEIDKNPFTTLPNSIGDLSQLTFLSLSKGNMQQLPNKIAALTHLTKLLLIDFDSIPSIFFQLPNIQVLKIENSKGLSLGREIKYLKKLQTLDMVNCAFYTLPKEIGKLKSLQYLGFRGDNLKEIPHQIGCCRNLVGLSMESCQIKSYPISIKKLKKLQFLNAGNYCEIFLPSFIPKMKKIKYITGFKMTRNMPDHIHDWYHLRQVRYEEWFNLWNSFEANQK